MYSAKGYRQLDIYTGKGTMKAVLIDDNEEFCWTFQKALEMETERADFPIYLTCRSGPEDIGQEEADDFAFFYRYRTGRDIRDRFCFGVRETQFWQGDCLRKRL